MTTTGELAEFVQETSFDDLSDEAAEAVKRRVLDSVGIALGAVGAETVDVVRETALEVSAGGGDGGACSVWASDESASPPDATMVNTTLTRYLDYMDSFLAPGETPHPSDNVGAAVACAEYAEASGEDLVAAIAVAYEVQGELAWNAPVREKGFDHVTHTVISAACAASKLLGLDYEETRHAIGIAGTAHNALRVTRTGGINEWKGVASANAARNAVYAAMLARNGMEGPTNLFEGQKGWQQVISGEFDVDLDPGCTRVFDTMTKRYVAETYAQSAVEGVVELAEQEAIDSERVEEIRLATFAGAKLIIGGGEGSRYEVKTKAEADHSLPYMLAAALVDRDLTADSYTPERIARGEVQELLRTVEVEEDPELTERFESGEEMPAVVDVTMDDGTTYRVEKDAFLGHPSNPMGWEGVEAKFRTMASRVYDEGRQDEIVDVVRNLDGRDAVDLVAVLD